MMRIMTIYISLNKKQKYRWFAVSWWRIHQLMFMSYANCSIKDVNVMGYVDKKASDISQRIKYYPLVDIEISQQLFINYGKQYFEDKIWTVNKYVSAKVYEEILSGITTENSKVSHGCSRSCVRQES